MIACCEPVIQKGSTDCALAALAMALGLPYRQVSEAALKMRLKAHTRGLYTEEMLRLAKRLKRPMRKVPGIVETGVLFVEKRRQAHAVTIFCGVLIDPADGLLWEPEAYIVNRKWKIAGSLQEVDNE